METKWSPRAYSEVDKEGMFKLRKAVYPETTPSREKCLRWLQWKYEDNPAGAAWIWLTEHNGEIVGQDGAIPKVIKMGSETVVAAQAVDAMTHPDYRQQGILKALLKTERSQMAKEDVCMVYRFPNPFSRMIGVRELGWFDISSLQTMIKPFNWANSIKLRVKSRFLRRVLAIGASLVFNKALLRTKKPPAVKGLTINRVSRFDDRVNGFWARVSSQSQIMVVRDKDYLNWRYGAPEANYSIFVAEKAREIYGYLVLQDKIENGVKVSRVFDLLAQSEQVMHCLLSKAIENCQQQKVDLILYHLIASKTYHRVLKRTGFLLLPFIKAAHFCGYCDSPSVPEEFLKNHENWFVQTGDSDVT